VDEVVVLRNDLSSWSRKVQGVRFFRAAEIVKLEDKVFRELTLVSPDNPSYTSVNQTEFVARSID
jgi:hypothetical protein